MLHSPSSGPTFSGHSWFGSSSPPPLPSAHSRIGLAERRPLAVYDEELESAGWYSRTQLLDLEESDALRLPRRDSIARRLIEDWLAAG